MTNSFLLALKMPEIDLDFDDQELFKDNERADGGKFCECGYFIC